MLEADIRYTHENRGIWYKSSNTPLNKQNSNEQISFAPCLEYIWNENTSMAFGAWTTIYGRYSQAFAGIVANFYRSF